MKGYLFLLCMLYANFSMAEVDFTEANEFDGWLYTAFQNVNIESQSSIDDLGRPVSTEIRKDEYNEELEDIIVHLSGLEISYIRKPSENNKVWIYHVYANSSRWVFGDIKVGDASEKLKKYEKFYRENDGGYCGLNNCIKVKVANNLITDIELFLYVD